LAASIISLFICTFFISVNSNSDENNIKQYSSDEGVLSLMYHRFNESRYPSTNIEMAVFKNQIEIIQSSTYSFSNPNEFEKEFTILKKNKEILITIDDAFKSFYNNAWPYVKKKRIPFILFLLIQPVGKKGYMTWDEIREIESESFVMIGHHSHSHGYLINDTNDLFVEDINKANRIFLKELGYIPSLFSYPFGEYSKFMRDYISQNFSLAFGQHSGVIDVNKNKFELPRFPINENYGDLKRFSSILNSFPLEYEQILPHEKKLNNKSNPPEFKVKFFKHQKNLENINCYSNELDKWEKSKTNFQNETLTIKFRGPFKPRRGRINCSLNDNGKWRWFGIQFPIIDY